LPKGICNTVPVDTNCLDCLRQCALKMGYPL
jgi:hypothetical protein